MSDAVQPPVFSSDLQADTSATADHRPDSAPISASFPAALSTSAEYRRGVRYGISLTAVLFGVYLVLQWNPGPLLTFGSSPPLLMAQSLFQLSIAVLLAAVGLAVAPASPARTLPMALLVLVLVPLSALALYLRMTGWLPPMPVWLWNLMSPGTVALGTALLGWLVVRSRPVLTYVLVLGALLPALGRFAVLIAGAETSLVWYTDLLLSAVVGVGAAWVAALVARLAAPAPG